MRRRSRQGGSVEVSISGIVRREIWASINETLLTRNFSTLEQKKAAWMNQAAFREVDGKVDQPPPRRGAAVLGEPPELAVVGMMVTVGVVPCEVRKAELLLI